MLTSDKTNFYYHSKLVEERQIGNMIIWKIFAPRSLIEGWKEVYEQQPKKLIIVQKSSIR